MPGVHSTGLYEDRFALGFMTPLACGVGWLRSIRARPLQIGSEIHLFVTMGNTTTPLEMFKMHIAWLVLLAYVQSACIAATTSKALHSLAMCRM